MTNEEIRLRCMELAMAQAKIENVHQSRERVAEIQTWFYDRIVSAPPPAQPAGKRKSTGADKGPEIFG